MDLPLKAQFARLGPAEAMSRVASGSPVALLLERRADITAIQTIPAIMALARRWMPMLRAKRLIEAVVEDRRAFARIPKVESTDALVADLAVAGIRATLLPDGDVDIKALRERLGLTQDQFAIRYGLDLDAVRNWEHGRRKPDTAARSYLRMIERNPQVVEETIWSV